MPHLTIEHTKNLEHKIDTQNLITMLHQSLKNCVGLDMNRVKSRLVCHEQVICGPGASEIQMIHVTLSILSGRDLPTRKSYSEPLFQVLQDFTSKQAQPISLTVEVREMERETYFRN